MLLPVEVALSIWILVHVYLATNQGGNIMGLGCFALCVPFAAAVRDAQTKDPYAGYLEPQAREIHNVKAI